MYLIKIFQSIICHQLTRFFSNKNSINHKNPSSCDKTNKTPSTLLLPWRHSKPRFLLIRPPPKTVSVSPRCNFTNAQLVLWLQPLKGISLGAWDSVVIFHQPGKSLKFSGFFPFQKATFFGGPRSLFVWPDCIFCLRRSKPQQGTKSMLDRILEVWLQRREWRNLWRLTFSTKFIHVIWSWLHDQAHMTHG